MKIAVDLDEVVLDFTGGLRSALKKEYDVDLEDKDIVQYNLRPLLDPILGRSWWAWLRDRDWLWSNFPAVNGAIGALDILRREGHYLVCVTSKPKWAEGHTWKWLGKWRPPFQQVIIVSGDDIKADFTDADILIDDKYENCLDFASRGRLAILFDRPYNRQHVLEIDVLGHGIIRGIGWRGVLEIIGGTK